MNEYLPWRGGREKDLESMQILIEILTTPASVVLDAYRRLRAASALSCRMIIKSKKQCSAVKKIPKNSATFSFNS